MKQCSAELTDPQNFSRDDFTRFVSTLALPVHVAASLTNIENWKQMAIQVSSIVILSFKLNKKIINVRFCELDVQWLVFCVHLGSVS